MEKLNNYFFYENILVLNLNKNNEKVDMQTKSSV